MAFICIKDKNKTIVAVVIMVYSQTQKNRNPEGGCIPGLISIDSDDFTSQFTP